MKGFNHLGYADDALSVKVSELLVATADESDAMVDQAITDVLRLLRERMKMDVVFVSEFVEGRRVFRQVDAATPDSPLQPGASDPLEETWCQRVVDGRLPGFIADARRDPQAAPLLGQLPFPIGTHISTPVVLGNGEVYGTLCCFSFHPQDQPNPEDLSRLQLTAQLAARKLELRRQKVKPPASVPDWELKPR